MMNKEFLTLAVVVTFLLLAYGIEVLIDTFKPDMGDLFRCAILVAAAVAVGAIALRFVP